MLQNLTGGNAGGLHMTDVTNASRTMLMNIHTLKWDRSYVETSHNKQRLNKTFRQLCYHQVNNKLNDKIKSN